MIRALALALAVLAPMRSSSLHSLPLSMAPTTATSASTGALCQLDFSGVLGRPLLEGGNGPSWYTISVTHIVNESSLESVLEGQLRRGTSANHLYALLAARLEAAGGSVIRTRGDGAQITGLFIEGVQKVRLDLPGCQEVSVTFCDRPLSVLSLRATGEAPGNGELEFLGVVRGVDGKTRAQESIQVSIEAGESGHDVCKRLFDASLESGWLPVRPATDRWSPSRRKDARTLQSTEISLHAPGWELELTAG